MERSERWGVWAVRGPGSIFGPAADWSKRDGMRMEFGSVKEAEARVATLTESVPSENVHYSAVRIEE